MDNTTSLPSKEEIVVLSLENPVFRSYLFACALLILKVLFLPLMVGRYRFGRGILMSPEDVPMAKVCLGKAEIKHDDPDLERVRRAHLNDIENIPIFMIAALCYVFTMPSPLTAATMFYMFFGFRVLHTLVYAVIVIPQPARIIAYLGGILITLYLIIMVLIKIPPV